MYGFTLIFYDKNDRKSSLSAFFFKQTRSRRMPAASGRGKGMDGPAGRDV